MIYITGDTHGDLRFLKRKGINKIKKNDLLIILGDFGFLWNGSESEQKALEVLSQKKYKILFIDGTHENFNMLNNYPKEEIFGGQGYRICNNLFRLERGEIYNIEDKTILCLGGGCIQDEEFYIGAESGLDQAVPSPESLQKAKDNLSAAGNKVDYILSHQAPGRVMGFVDKSAIEKNHINIAYDDILLNNQFDKWYFGSYHVDRVATPALISVYENVIKLL